MISICPIGKSDVTAFREVLDEVCRERRFLRDLEAPSAESVQAFIEIKC